MTVEMSREDLLEAAVIDLFDWILELDRHPCEMPSGYLSNVEVGELVDAVWSANRPGRTFTVVEGGDPHPVTSAAVKPPSFHSGESAGPSGRPGAERPEGDTACACGHALAAHITASGCSECRCGRRHVERIVS